MAKGKVKFFNAAKGFGFIVPDDGGKELFVHMSNVEAGQHLDEGVVVVFEIAQDPKGKGPCAVKVKKA